MKIGFDAKRAFLNVAGLGNYSRNTLNALRKFFPQNEYILFTPVAKTALFENITQFNIISPPHRFFKLLKPFWRSFFLTRYLRKYDLDLFHGLSNELPRGIHKSGIPSVVTIHDLIFMRYPEFYKPVDRNIYFRKVKYACQKADKIIAISQQTKNDIESFFQVSPENIDVIYQPVASVFYEKQEFSRLFSKYNLPEKYILSVGTLEPRKNQLALLKALQHAKIELPVVFAGKPKAYISEMKKFISKNRMEKQVFFLTGLSDRELAGLYQNAFLSVYISVFEGFGLPVIEAMAGGCPVVTSSVSCLPETAGDAAVLCDPGNVEEIGEKIKFLLGNNSFRNEIIQKGKERAELFHPGNYAKKLISFYTKMIVEKNAK